MNYIDYGLSCCDASEIAKEEAGRFDLADVFSRLSREDALAGYEAEERFYETGSFSGIEDFTRYIEGKGED
jgi:hypothetical protein